MLFLGLVFVLGFGLPVNSYIPASPTNSTRDAIAGGLNVTDISNLQMQWFSNGSYSEHVSYQLAGNGSNGISKGVLVHFSEEMANNLTAPTLTPWIALVSCDKNATNASMDEDIFTLARDKGAVSALLYSLTSTACVINPEYSDPSTFDQVFDIFSTQSSTSSHLIEYQFGQLSPQNKSLYAYDSKMLNESANDILRSINSSSPVSPGYLLAVLQAYNATGDNSGPSNPGSAAGGNPSGNSSSPNTALAMIILYAITGCVSALFCIVIVSGAIRAIRHPERYGPRARMGGDGGPPQSRARGLTRAILDTFPIVKFGSAQATPYRDQHSSTSGSTRDKDVEIQSQGYNLEMESLSPKESAGIPTVSLAPPTSSGSGSAPVQPSEKEILVVAPEIPHIAARPLSPSPSGTSANKPMQPADLGEGSSRDGAVTAEAPSQSGRDDVVPASIGRETCPICIVDFEEGDDIRVLPCEGKHCFHQHCVDPWLLKLSSSCPICRHDFLALENMLSGIPDDEVEEEEEMDNYISHPRGHGNAGRFSRYLRFAHRRQHSRRGDESDPTDPYMPTAPDTSMYPGL
ncbi:hypothetical protein GALMADRAFT_226525 [Galerina marginata CBS 339.88]|uniref:RING-type domain-containing protein n=1 Tax=Galerina marginata (strain CBS 339.88) TaxID=685588 RepID=A0A067SYB4_GALM3|nr:hypothetical protein GALMADRAFT_226525 [Galerina marginata CBS 339.88]